MGNSLAECKICRTNSLQRKNTIENNESVVMCINLPENEVYI